MSKRENLLWSVLIMLSLPIASRADYQTRIEDLEAQMKDVWMQTELETYGAQCANYRPDANQTLRWSLGVEGLCLFPKIDGTEFAYSDKSPLGDLPTTGSVKENSFNCGLGIRLNTGYHFQSDTLDLQLEYLYFQSQSEDQSHRNTGSSLIPLKGLATILPLFGSEQDAFLFCQNASSSFDVSVQTLRLDLGKESFVSKHFAFEPRIGIVTGWFHCKQTVRYSGGEQSIGGDFPILIGGLGPNTVEVEDGSRYWGIGPRVFLLSELVFGKGLSVFGMCAGTLLYGFNDVHHEESFSGSVHHTVSLNADMHHFVPGFEYQLGIMYSYYFVKKKQYLDLHLSYESQFYWGVDQPLNINVTTGEKYIRGAENLGLSGITLGIRFSY